MKWSLRVLILLALIFVGFGPGYASGQFFFQDQETMLVGKAAPDFKLKMLSGKESSLTGFRNGQNTIVFFWATWCPHCREQLAQLTKEKEAIERKGIKIALVDLAEEVPQVRAYVEKYKVDSDVFLDQDGKVSEQYSVIGVPTFFFVNKEGVIKSVEHALPENYEILFSPN